jgi:hypothetical protein
VGWDANTDGGQNSLLGANSSVLAGGNSIAVGYNADVVGGQNTLVGGESIVGTNVNTIDNTGVGFSVQITGGSRNTALGSQAKPDAW